MYSTKYAVGIHILSLIALNDKEPITSECIASSVNTNPALVRRLMSSLKKAGLIHTQTKIGVTGLARSANEISLKDIFQAVEKQQTLFAVHTQPNKSCPVGARIGNVLAQANQHLQEHFEDELDSIYLSDVLNGLSETVIDG